MKTKSVFSFFLAFLMGMGALILATSAGEAQTWKTPESVSIVTLAVGSVKFQGATAFSGALTDTTGVRFNVRPEATETARLQLLRRGRVHLLLEASSPNYFASKGIDIFDKDGWGPQRLRTIWVVTTLYGGFAVLGDSGIKTLADLKGKKIPRYVAYRALQTYMDALKASWLEGVAFKEVPVPGYKEACNALKEGALDMAYDSCESLPARELQASRHGIRWLPLPFSDEKNWEKFLKVTPYYSKVLATNGAGISKERPYEGVGFSDRWLTYDWQDENFVYWFTKNLDKTIPSAAKLHNYLKEWSRDKAVNLVEAVSPYHPGAIKYLKEIGIWGPKEEKWQTEKIAEENKQIAEWKANHPSWTYKNKEE